MAGPEGGGLAARAVCDGRLRAAVAALKDAEVRLVNVAVSVQIGLWAEWALAGRLTRGGLAGRESGHITAVHVAVAIEIRRQELERAQIRGRSV